MNVSDLLQVPSEGDGLPRANVVSFYANARPGADRAPALSAPAAPAIRTQTPPRRAPYAWANDAPSGRLAPLQRRRDVPLRKLPSIVQALAVHAAGGAASAGGATASQQASASAAAASASLRPRPAERSPLATRRSSERLLTVLAYLGFARAQLMPLFRPDAADDNLRALAIHAQTLLTYRLERACLLALAQGPHGGARLRRLANVLPALRPLGFAALDLACVAARANGAQTLFVLQRLAPWLLASGVSAEQILWAANRDDPLLEALAGRLVAYAVLDVDITVVLRSLVHDPPAQAALVAVAKAADSSA